MSERVFQIVRRGSWLYDHTVPAEVQIVRRNYFDGPKIVDEEPTPGYPPTVRIPTMSPGHSEIMSLAVPT
jgi:hypothetical protein